MRKANCTCLMIIVLCLLSLNLSSQTRAVTERGDTIFVYDNGTWSFEELEYMPQVNEFDFLGEELQIDTIDAEFTYPQNAKKQVKNGRNQFVIKYNDKLWKRVPPATLNEEAEFAFQSKSSDIWCVVISEETPIEPDNLFRIAKKTMEDNTGAKVKSLKTELVTVNGKQLIRGVIGAKLSGISFIFDSYYFSNDAGSVQFVTWTSDKVWERTEKDILNLLNGFIVE